MAYDQYYKKVTKKRKFLVDLDSSFYRDITDLDKEEIQKLKIGIKRFSDMREKADELDIDKNQLPHQLDIQEVEREFVELNIMLNGQPIYTGDDKTGINQTYPFVPVICYMEPSIWMPSQRLQGIGAASWSIQRQFNKRHMKIIDIMDTSLQNSYKYLLGSVPDPEEFQQSGPNRIIGVDPDNAPQGLDSVQQLSSPDVNPSLIQYQQILDQLTLTLTNVNESILGIDDKGNTQVSGRLAQVRIAQGLRSNRKIFDNVEVSQKILGTLVLKAIQSHYTPAKVKRILGEEPTEQFYEKDFEQYDAVIKEGVYSQSQRDAYYYELVSLKRDQIVDVPQTAIIDALQMAGVSDLKDSIAKQEEAAKAQQAKVAEQEKIALELANSQVASNLALASVRRARERGEVGLMVERISEAEQNRSKATLDRAKTMAEIAKMQDDRILKVLDFVNMLELQESSDRNSVNAQVNAVTKDLENEPNQQQPLPENSQQNQQQNVMQNTNLGG
jgi:hypothetical protein